MAPAPPSAIGHFAVESELGHGGMGVVYRARDTRLNRTVALKFLAPAGVYSDVLLTRFAREARILASIHNPHIASIYGYEEIDGWPLLVLEYVNGITLRALLDRGPLPVEDALRTCLQIAEALQAAHDLGVIHCDVTPTNVKIASDGVVKVLDFGIAKTLPDLARTVPSPGPIQRFRTDSPEAASATTSPLGDLVTPSGPSGLVGTPPYMSPEQVTRHHVDKRTDIWAFGCVLFECLTGHRAFRRPSVPATILAILDGAVDWGALPTDCPERIRSLLKRCLCVDADLRLEGISYARLELEEALSSMWRLRGTAIDVDKPKHNLRRLSTRFVGRQAFVTQARALLRVGRLLTLIGAPGLGKTRLASQLGHRLLGEFTDGVWMIEVADVSDPGLLAQVTGEILGVQAEDTERLVAEIKAKQALLILDACEHHREACAALAASLVRGCPSLHVLATATRALDIGGEATYAVPPLAAPEPTDNTALDEVRKVEAVELFVDRVLPASSGFILDEDNVASVTRMCRYLGGAPLALELAAARVGRHLPLASVANLLSEHFDVCAAEQAIGPDETVRAVIDWSYGLLAEEEKTLFRRLAVFVGGCTADAVFAVCTGGGVQRVFDSLMTLVESGLVVVEGRTGGTRYGMAHPVRRYAQALFIESSEWSAITDGIEITFSILRSATLRRSSPVPVRRRG